MSIEARIPGIAAQHAVITPQCRSGKTAGGAFEEAVERLRQEYEACQNDANTDANFHLVLTVERSR